MKKQYITPEITVGSFDADTEMLVVSGVVYGKYNGTMELKRWTYEDTDDEGFIIGTKPNNVFDDYDEEE